MLVDSSQGLGEPDTAKESGVGTLLCMIFMIGSARRGVQAATGGAGGLNVVTGACGWGNRIGSIVGSEGSALLTAGS